MRRDELLLHPSYFAGQGHARSPYGRHAHAAALGLLLWAGCLGTAPTSPPASPVSSQRTLAPRRLQVEGLTFTAENGTRNAAASCPIGNPNCTPENVQGIYNIEGGDFCIETGAIASIGSTAGASTTIFWSHWFCPIGLVNRAQGVFLRGLWHTSEDASQYRYAEARLGAELRGEQVTPVAVTSMESRLQVRYRGGDDELHVLSGTEVSELLLIFRIDERLHELRLGQPRTYPSDAESAGIWEYPVAWRQQGASRFSAWRSLCRGVGDRGTGNIMPASFLGEVRFDPFTARRSTDEAVVTMSCQQGGITKCLEAGYQPWSPRERLATNTTEEPSETHAACVQRRGVSPASTKLAQRVK